MEQTQQNKEIQKYIKTLRKAFKKSTNSELIICFNVLNKELEKRELIKDGEWNINNNRICNNSNNN